MYDFCALPRDQQSALLAEYRASLPAARQRFVELVAGEAPGASPDGRLPSLIAANEFFLHKIVAPAPWPALDESEGPLPVWWDPAVATGRLDEGSPITRAQLQLVDGIQAYAATVAESLAGATWATFQGDKKDFRNGRPVLLNVSGVAIDIRDLAYGEALNASYRGRTVAISYLHDVISDWAVGDS